MLDTLIIADTMPRLLGQPPPPPPSRYEMIETLEKHNQWIFGPIEDLDNMNHAELWKRYRKWKELRDSLVVY